MTQYRITVEKHRFFYEAHVDSYNDLNISSPYFLALTPAKAKAKAKKWCRKDHERKNRPRTRYNFDPGADYDYEEQERPMFG